MKKDDLSDYSLLTFPNCLRLPSITTIINLFGFTWKWNRSEVMVIWIHGMGYRELTQFVFTLGDVTLSQYPQNIWELDVPPSDDTNTWCTVHDAFVRNRISETYILSPWVQLDRYSKVLFQGFTRKELLGGKTFLTIMAWSGFTIQYFGIPLSIAHPCYVDAIQINTCIPLFGQNYHTLI